MILRKQLKKNRRILHKYYIQLDFKKDSIGEHVVKYNHSLD